MSIWSFPLRIKKMLHGRILSRPHSMWFTFTHCQHVAHLTKFSHLFWKDDLFYTLNWGREKGFSPRFFPYRFYFWRLNERERFILGGEKMMCELQLSLYGVTSVELKWIYRMRPYKLHMALTQIYFLNIVVVSGQGNSKLTAANGI